MIRQHRERINESIRDYRFSEVGTPAPVPQRSVPQGTKNSEVRKDHPKDFKGPQGSSAKVKGRRSRSTEVSWRQIRERQRRSWRQEGGRMLAFRDRRVLDAASNPTGPSERVQMKSWRQSLKTSQSTHSTPTTPFERKRVSVSALKRAGCDVMKVGTQVPLKSLTGVIMVVKRRVPREDRTNDPAHRFVRQRRSQSLGFLGLCGLRSETRKSHWFTSPEEKSMRLSRVKPLTSMDSDAPTSMTLEKVWRMQRRGGRSSPRMQRASLLAMHVQQQPRSSQGSTETKDTKDIKDTKVTETKE